MPKLPQKSGLTMMPAPQVAKPVFVDVHNSKYGLRTATSKDVIADVAAWMSDPVVISGLNGSGQVMSLDHLRGYISGFDNVRKNLTVIHSVADDRPIGLLMFDIEPRHKIGSFHILIGSKGHRIGEASYVAVRLLLRHMFEMRGVEKVSIEPLSRNRAVVQYCEWLGFRLEGVLKSHRADSQTGARLDQHVFAMTRDEYRVWDKK